MVKILLVDSDTQFVELISSHLNKKSWSLDSVNDPRKVIPLLQNGNHQYDVVVSEIKIPYMNGIKLFENLRKKNISVPFFILTENGSEKIVIKALNAGIDKYLIKHEGLDNFTHHINLTIKQKQIEEKHSNQLEELRELASTMSHDLRNCLSVITGHASLLATDTKNLMSVAKIIMQVERINGILSHSVELANVGKSVEKTDKVDLVNLLQQVIETVLPKDLEIVFQEITPLMIKGDQQKLFQLFKNILENSLTHGLPSKIMIDILIRDWGCEIRISNNGKHITDERLINLQNGKITGQGIKIIQKIIKGHQWILQIQNKPYTSYIIKISSEDIIG